MRPILRSLVAASAFVLLGTGCRDNPLRLPTSPAPQPPPTARGVVWGYVIDDSGGCLIPAVVEIVEGPDVGKKVVQAEPCSIWDYGDGGFQFRDVPLGVPVRLRAMKEGYRAEERQVTAGNRVEIVLKKQ